MHDFPVLTFYGDTDSIIFLPFRELSVGITKEGRQHYFFLVFLCVLGREDFGTESTGATAALNRWNGV